MRKIKPENNDQLIDYLVDQGRIKTEKVEEAFRNVDRADFVPEEYKDEAYLDKPLPIGEDATISAPHMVAINTELLEVERGDEVVEIGSGSGYQAALLSELTNGKVTGVEINEKLVEESRQRLQNRENVEIIHGSGFEPVEDSKFDKILYSCAINSFDPAKKFLKGKGKIFSTYKNR